MEKVLEELLDTLDVVQYGPYRLKLDEDRVLYQPNFKDHRNGMWYVHQELTTLYELI